MAPAAPISTASGTIRRKAFYAAPLPFPLLHVDTTWKFRAMIEFRDETARRLDLNLLVYVNHEGIARGISPFASGSSLHTHVMKTEALKQALRPYRQCGIPAIPLALRQAGTRDILPLAEGSSLCSTFECLC
jgi:3'-phosphoadenosine 5'-phosphosulfate sulfotransferase (PAPS reductase)/FAD synthetase